MPLAPGVAGPALDPAWGDALPSDPEARACALRPWAAQPEPGALAAVAGGRALGLALGRATACGFRIDAIHGEVAAVVEAASHAFRGQRLEVYTAGEPRADLEGFELVDRFVYYAGPLAARSEEPAAGVDYGPYDDERAREVLTAVWPDGATPTGRAVIEQLAELQLVRGRRLWRIAYRDGEPVGVALARRDGDRGVLDLLAVVAGRRGEGLGGVLHRDALALLHADGATHYEDATAAGNAAMRRLLERAGAREQGTLWLYARDSPERVARLRRPGGVAAVEWPDGDLRAARVTAVRAARRAILQPLLTVPINPA